MGKCRTTARMNVKRMKNIAKSKLFSSLEKASKTRFKVTSSYAKGSKVNKDSHTFVALDHMSKAEPYTEWTATYGPDRIITQQEYMEMMGESYTEDTQSKLWFGESWATRQGPRRWGYDSAIDFNNSRGVSAGYVDAENSLAALSTTVDALTTTNVHEESIAELKERITTLETRIQELEARIDEREY